MVIVSQQCADFSTQEAEPWWYPPSWVDRLDDLIERLPGPGWLVYLVLALLLPLVHAGIKWWDGSYPVGTFHPFHVVVMISGVWFMGLAHYLNWAARRAMQRFRPALDCTTSNCDELEYRLTTLPARPIRWITLAGVLFGVLVVIGVARGLVFDPAALTFTSPLAVWFESAIGIFVCVSFCLLVYHTIHQVRMVNQIYTTNTVIDLFDLTPIHAFSVLTAQTATGGLPIAYAWIVTEPGVAGDTVFVAAVITLIVVALVTFLWPLLGIHQMLEAEKSQAETEAGQRIKTCIAELHGRIDNKLASEVEAPLKALAGLKQELELLEKISTWPWQPDTIRGLATAIILPVAVWFITRWLDGFLSF